MMDNLESKITEMNLQLKQLSTTTTTTTTTTTVATNPTSEEMLFAFSRTIYYLILVSGLLLLCIICVIVFYVTRENNRHLKLNTKNDNQWNLLNGTQTNKTDTLDLSISSTCNESALIAKRTPDYIQSKNLDTNTNKPNKINNNCNDNDCGGSNSDITVQKQLSSASRQNSFKSGLYNGNIFKEKDTIETIKQKLLMAPTIKDVYSIATPVAIDKRKHKSYYVVVNKMGITRKDRFGRTKHIPTGLDDDPFNKY